MARSEVESVRQALTQLQSRLAAPVLLCDPVLWAAVCGVNAAVHLLTACLSVDADRPANSGPCSDATRRALLEAVGDCRAAIAAVTHAVHDLPPDTGQTGTTGRCDRPPRLAAATTQPELHCGSTNT